MKFLQVSWQSSKLIPIKWTKDMWNATYEMKCWIMSVKSDMNEIHAWLIICNSNLYWCWNLRRKSENHEGHEQCIVTLGEIWRSRGIVDCLWDDTRFDKMRKYWMTWSMRWGVGDWNWFWWRIWFAQWHKMLVFDVWHWWMTWSMAWGLVDWHLSLVMYAWYWSLK